MTFYTSGHIRDPLEAPHIVSSLSEHFWSSYITHPPSSSISRYLRIAYVNADQRTESVTLTSASSCFSADVYPCLDCVQCEPAFPKAELVHRERLFSPTM